MPCGECDRLRKENRELREEIREWESSAVTTLESHRVRDYLGGARPQCVSVCMALCISGGRVVLAEDLIDGAGLSENQSPRNSLQVAISHLRRSLRNKGLPGGEIKNMHGVGYVMSRAIAAEIKDACRG